jgi:hypothetical protein
MTPRPSADGVGTFPTAGLASSLALLEAVAGRRGALADVSRWGSERLGVDWRADADMRFESIERGS